MPLRPLFFALALIALPAIGRSASVTVAPLHDNTLFEDAEGDVSNGAGTGLFCGRNSLGVRRRAVLAFDPAGALPAGAVLDSVRLVLHAQPASDLLPRTVRLHRLLAGWGEGASFTTGGSGAPAATGDATWLHAFYPSTFWSTPGGDFAPEPSAALGVLGEGDCVWSSPGLTDDVRTWIADPATRFGWIVLGDETGNNTARRFDSRESTPPEFRPRLLLFFSSPTAARSISWGRLKLSYQSTRGVP